MRRLLLACALLAAWPGCLLDDRTIEVTLIGAYTPAAAARVGDVEAALRRAVAETNASYRASRVDVRLRLVRAVAVPDEFSGDRVTDLNRIVHPGDGFFDGLHALRDRYQADLVVVVPDDPRATIPAAILARPEAAFVVVHAEHLGAPFYGLAHELGHLQGARHTLDSDPATEPFAFGHGFRNARFRTIMANGTQQRVARWSSPHVVVEGDTLGDAATADVARVLNTTAAYVAGFRGPAPPTTFVPAGTWPFYDPAYLEE